MEPSEIGKVGALQDALSQCRSTLIAMMIVIDRYNLDLPFTARSPHNPDLIHWHDALAEARLLLGYDKHD